MSYIVFEGRKIYYETYGQGKPIVLLNGIMMSTLSWQYFIDIFSVNNQLILMDFFDQGRSDKLEGVQYTLDIQVEALKALFDELKLMRVNLVGISYGGEVALQFSVKYQEYVESLVLFNTTANTSPWLKDIGTGWNLSTGDPMDYYCTTIPVIYSPKFYNENNEWMEKRKSLLTQQVFNQKAFMDSLVRLTESAETHDVVGELSKINVPTLIIGSESDFVTPLPEQKLLHQLIRSSEFVVLPETGHASMYERPVLFTALVLGFVNLEQKSFKIV